MDEAAKAPPVRVLMVEDDEPLRDMVVEYLGERDLLVDAEGDGLRGLERAQSGGYALLVLDVRLPSLDGLEVLRRLRACGSEAARLPVIMLTAHGDEIDRIVGLELGADDYVPKPFNPRELLARIRAILRRASSEAAPVEASKNAAAPDNLLRCGEVEMDVAARTVRRDGEELELSAAEFDLLHALLCPAGQVVGRDELARAVLGRRPAPFDRSLDIHLHKLRHKLWPGEDGLRRIKTVRGVGFLFVKDGDKDEARGSEA